jgi:hypothetical protein
MRLLAILLLLNVAAGLSCAEPSVLGYWVNPDDPDDTTAFEKDRAITLDHGRIQYWLARYVPGKVILGWLGEASVPYHWDGEILVVDVPPKNPRWHRVAAMPKELKEPEFVIPDAKAIDGQARTDLITELQKRGVEDQAVRTDPARQGEMAKVDADNTAWLTKQVQVVGWLDGKRFGAQGANVAFLLVQHSGNLPLMEATLPLIAKDRENGFCDPQNFALLFDRVQVFTGHKQRYGSQIGAVNGKQALYPLEDRAKVDEFRKSIGLFSLEDYLGMYKQMAHAEVIFMDDLPVAGMP